MSVGERQLSLLLDGAGVTLIEGRAVIDIDFEPGWDMARATDDVQTMVSATGAGKVNDQGIVQHASISFGDAFEFLCHSGNMFKV